MLELIWGVGFMAPGGQGNIAKLVEGLEVEIGTFPTSAAGSVGPHWSWPRSTAPCC